jgi:autotransporter-associated beta strand protein
LGNTTVQEGTLLLGKSAFVQAVPHNLIIGSGLPGGPVTVARNSNHDQVGGNITVNSGGLLDLNGWNETIGELALIAGGNVQTFAGTLTVTNNVTVTPGSNTTSTISGKLGFDTGDRTITVGNGATPPGIFELEIPAVISQPNGHSIVNLRKAGTGKARFTAINTYSGTTTVAGGVLQIDGAQPQSPVTINGGRLQGVGTVGHITLTSNPASVAAPGASPGLLTCSNFAGVADSRGKLEIELNGTTPGTQYDQLNVRGTVNLTSISLLPSLGFLSSTGQTFTIINNDGSDGVVGTFNGLTQNEKFYIGGELFQINYAGGTGNDVVLTRLITPPPPTLLIEQIDAASVRLLWRTNEPVFRLQSNTNVSTSTWSIVNIAPSVSGTNYVVTNAATGFLKSYRLINP